MTTISPWLSVRDATEALAFYKAAFGAVDIERHVDDAGALQVAQLWIGGADFWIQTDPDSCPDMFESRSSHMILAVDEPDIVFARALAAGATEINAMDDAYGWRIGKLADPCGHQWEIGRRLEG